MNDSQEYHDDDVKDFLSSVLKTELPKGTLQDILKDGILLCDLISTLIPEVNIVKNEGKTKFAYQDNIGQFLREIKRFHIPQSDLFQTVDLLEEKRSKNVVSCLLAIKRITCDKKLRPNTIRSKKRNTVPLTNLIQENPSIFTSQYKTNTLKQSVSRNYIKSQSNFLSAQILPSSPTCTGKNSPEIYFNTEQIMTRSRKVSLKKMGSCTITIQNNDSSYSIYALGKSIGKGQFGEVFGGLNMDTGEYVAIKRIKRNQIDCDDMNEVDVLRNLNHEYIVRYKGFSKDNTYINIILEYVEMGSLLNNIKSFGKFPEKLAASYTYKILSGLHYLHSQKVIHCDLKAANILTTKSGGLKLTDFGVSLTMKIKENEKTESPTGTPNWMAPEVIKLAGASNKSDIWSLGCTVVEMLTGKPPYSDMHSLAILYNIVEDNEPPIPKNLELTDDAWDFLLVCFKKCPKDRPSAFELMKHKWMTPFFEKEEASLIQKSKQYNCTSCALDDLNNKYDLTLQTCSVCFSTIKRDTQPNQYNNKDCKKKLHMHCVKKNKDAHLINSFVPIQIFPVKDQKLYYLPEIDRENLSQTKERSEKTGIGIRTFITV